MSRLEVRILGCGSSGGVPRPDGDWGACDPADPRNARTRCSLLVRLGSAEAQTCVVIDTSPDFRSQALSAGLSRLDAVLFTHDHADQAHGLDDVRTFAMRSRRRIPTYMNPDTRRTLGARFGYVFDGELGYPPVCEAMVLPGPGGRFTVEGPGGALPVQVFDQAHGVIRSVGYRLGPVVYSPDVSDLDEAAFDVIRGAELWIVDALRWTPHPTHAHVDQTLDWIARSGVGRAVLTNLHIDLDYATLKSRMPAHVDVAHDGWTAQFQLAD